MLLAAVVIAVVVLAVVVLAAGSAASCCSARCYTARCWERSTARCWDLCWEGCSLAAVVLLAVGISAVLLAALEGKDNDLFFD